MIDPLEVSVSMQRKINIGNYESVDVFFSISHVRQDTSDEELVEAIRTGDRAYEAVKAAVMTRVAEIQG